MYCASIVCVVVLVIVCVVVVVVVVVVLQKCLFVYVHAPVLVVVIFIVVHSNMAVHCVVDIDVCITTDIKLTCCNFENNFMKHEVLLMN